MEAEMNVMYKKWRSDDGGIDFIQVVVGLLIISIAAVGTLHAMYYGWQQLDQQMRYRKAVSLARSYMEYMQGRIHTDFEPNDIQFMSGNLTHPLTWKLDERDPYTTFDDIECQVSYGPIVQRDFPTTGDGVDQYEMQVHVTWFEPTDLWSSGHSREIVFFGTMVPAAL
jgi:hypothetical protein